MRPPRDTAPDIWSRQLDAYRAMPPTQRLRRALELSEEVKNIARAGIRHAHPEWATADVEAELARRLYERPSQRVRSA